MMKWIALIVMLLLGACGTVEAPVVCQPHVYSTLELRCNIAPIAGIAGHGGMEDTLVCRQFAYSVEFQNWVELKPTRNIGWLIRMGDWCRQGEVTVDGSPVPVVFPVPTPTILPTYSPAAPAG